MKKNNLSRLTLENIQIKSAEKFKTVCQAIDVLEKETFIRSGEIKFEDVFVCPDFDLVPFYQSYDPTERLIAKLCISLHVQKWGDDAKEDYKKIVEHEHKIMESARKIHRRNGAK